MWIALLPVLALGAADTPEAGQYRVTKDQVSVRREVWGLYCDSGANNPRPGVGKKLTLTAQGAEWTAKGAGRRFGTATCEGRNKTLAATKRSQKAGVITLSCRSKRVTLGTEESTHKVSFKDDVIRYETVAKQHFKRRGDDCVSVLERVTEARFIPPPKKEAEAAVDAEPEPPNDPCATPGPVAKLALGYTVFDAKVAESPSCFSPTATDKNGCAVPIDALTYAVDPKGAGAVKKGCFSPSKSIQEEEAVAVIARLGGVEAAATARVVPAAEERAQKTLKALAKTSRSKRAQALLGEVTRGEIVIRPLEGEAVELAPLEAKPFPWLPVGGAGVLALIASVAGVVLSRRRQPARPEPTELQAKPVVTPKKGGALVCPACGFQYAVGEATHCRFDGAELKPLETDARQTMFVPAAGGMICPTCHTKYPTKARFCGHDRTPLLPDFGQFDGPASDPSSVDDES